MIENTVTLIHVCDKVNTESTKLAVKFFKKTYGDDGKVILINTHRCDEINEFGRIEKILVINPSYELPYPKYSLNDAENFWNWCEEVIYKPVMMVDTDYVVWGEPDCFFINKTNFLNYKDVDIISSIPDEISLSWWFDPLFCHVSNGHQTIWLILEDLKLILKHLNLDEDFLKSHIGQIFGTGSFLKTSSIQRLIFEKKDDIKYFHFNFLNSLYRHYKKYTLLKNDNFYMYHDFFISFILIVFGFKTKHNTNFLAIDPSNIYTKTPYDINDVNIDVLHPIKTYYVDKNQVWNVIGRWTD